MWSQYDGHSASSVAKSSSSSPSGAGVSSPAIVVSRSRQASRSSVRHGRCGWRASTYSSPSTTQSSSWVHSNRGAGAAAGSALSLRASSR